jgi:hypothetical protein
MLLLELELSSLLDFGGIQSSEADAALALAGKGGLLSAAQLRAIVSLCAGGWQERGVGVGRGEEEYPTPS